MEHINKTDPEQKISRAFIEAGGFATIVKFRRDTDMPLDDDSQLMYSLASTCFRLFQGGKGEYSAILAAAHHAACRCRSAFKNMEGLEKVMIKLTVQKLLETKSDDAHLMLSNFCSARGHCRETL